MGLLHKPLHQLLSSILLSLLATAPVVAESIPIRGRIVDEKGEGVAKAVVRLVPTVGHYSFAARELDHQDETAALLEVKSDATGRFQLEAPEIGIWWLKADAPGRVGADLLLSPLIEEVDLPPAVLARDAGMEVLVTTSDGKPAVGARVHGRSPAERSMRRLNWKPRSQRAWTDEEGRVRLFRVDGRRLAVRAFQAGSEEIDHQKTRGKRLTVPLPSAAAMLVEVRDHRNKPEAGAVLQLGEGGFVVGRTDEQGRLGIHVPKQGKMQVMAITEDLRMFKTTLTLPKDPAKPHILRLPELLTIDGKVVTKDRHPVAGALVWGEIAQPVRSAANGSFRLYEFAEDKTRLRAAAPGYFEGAAEVRPGSSTTLILDANTSLRGRVVDAQGDPVAKVEVEGTWQFRRGGGRNRNAYRSGGLSRSNEQGRFRLSSLMPGESYELKLQRDGYAPLRHTLLAPERGADVMTFVLLAGRRGSGIVVDENDEPVAGVEVNLYSELTNSNWTSRVMRQDAGADFSAVSSAGGTFHIDDLNAGRFRLTAQRGGFAPVSVPGIQVPEGGGETDLGILVMLPGVRVEGRAVGAQGEPLSEVEIFVRGGQAGMFPMGIPGGDRSAAAMTDVAGTFVLEDRRPEERFNLRAVKKGYATTELEGVQAPTESPVEIVMQLASTVAGRVVDEAGSPVAAAKVSIASAQANRITRRSQRQEGETDVDGRFLISEVPPGSIRVQAQSKGFQSSDQLEEVAAGKDLTGVEVILKLGATVIGKIVGPTGEPVTEAFVVVAVDNISGMRGGSQPPSARSDTEGSFRMEGIEPGRRSLKVRHEGYPTTTEVVDLELGETRVEIQLGGGQTVSGQVVDPEGTGLAGATVRLTSTGRYFGGMGQGQTSGDGLFEIEGVVDGKHALIAEHQSFANGRLEGVEVQGGPVSGLVVQLESGATISGRILGLDFDQLATAQVMAFSAEGGMRIGQVDYEEQYRIPQVAPAEWHVQVQTSSGRQARGQVTVAPGDMAVQLDIDFAGGASLEGRVLRGGEPVAGVQITVSSEAGDSHATGTSDHLGNFQLQGLAEGTNKLFAYDLATGVQHREEVELPASEPIELILSAAQLSGMVVDAIDQSPVSGAVVRVMPVAEGDPQLAMIANMLGHASSDDRGRFTVTSVSAGEWKLIAEKDGYTSEAQLMTVTGDEEINGLELKLSPTEGLWLTISGVGTVRPAQVMIAMLDDAVGILPAVSYTVDADGRIFLPSVPAGPVQLVAGSNGYSTVIVQATAPTGRPVVGFTDEAIVEVQIPELESEALPSQATVYDLNHEPLHLFTPFGNVALAGHAVSAGKVIFTGVPQGAWSLEVKANDGRIWTQGITTIPGQRQVVVLDKPAVKAGQ